MTTLGFRYHILQNIGVSTPARAHILERAVSHWFSTLAWSNWHVPSPMHGVHTRTTVPFMSIGHLHATGIPSSSFREFNIVSVDGKPFYHELIDNEQGINIYDEAIDRLWQMVQLLEITIRASHDAVSIDRERIAIMFGNNTARPVPPLCLDRIPALQDSLRGFQDALYRSKPFELLLFESPIFTVNDEWFAIMRKGADALHTAYRAAMTALISQ